MAWVGEREDPFAVGKRGIPCMEVGVECQPQQQRSHPDDSGHQECGQLFHGTHQSLPGKWQAARCPSDFLSRGGSTSEQICWAIGQRVWNRQPLGGFTGDGISPVSRIGRRAASRSGSGTGTELCRTFVYGCSGLSRTSAVVPTSTILPRYITAMRSLIWCTTDRSCAMKRNVRWKRSCRSSIRLTI